VTSCSDPCIYSPEQGEESSLISSSDTHLSTLLNGINMHAQYCEPDFLNSKSLKGTSDRSTFQEWLTSMQFALDSLVPTSVRQTQTGKESTGNEVDCIAKSCVQLTILDLPGCSSKTPQGSEPKEGMSSSPTWWRVDIPGAMESLERLTLARRTEGTGGGYLPTVTATTSRQGLRSMAGGASKGIPLLGMAALSWPTPCATDHKTPYRGKVLAEQMAKRAKTLRDAISAPVGGKLNADWIEWLMGWPVGHTATGPVESNVWGTDKSHCVPPLHGDSLEGRES
jgi:hypothetical protein